MTSLVGRIDFSAGPVPNVCSTPVVGGQWKCKEDGSFDLAVAENQQAPEVPVDAAFVALS